MTDTRNNGGREAYAASVADMTDEALVAECETQCWFSAFANNNPRAPAHWKADALMDEARRREKPWLYAKGWNQAYRSCGFEPSEADIAAAQPLATRSSSKEA